MPLAQWPSSTTVLAELPNISIEYRGVYKYKISSRRVGFTSVPGPKSLFPGSTVYTYSVFMLLLETLV